MSIRMKWRTMKVVLAAREGRYWNIEYSMGHSSRVHVASGPKGMIGISPVVEFILIDEFIPQGYLSDEI